jgi:hypothetical protein
MKRFALIIMTLLLASSLFADVEKGKRYYMKNFKQKFKMNGLDFVQLHTQAEWKILFEDKGKGFILAFSKKYPKQKKFLNNPTTWKKLQHVRDFAIEYANDTGRVPSCSDPRVTSKPINLEVQDSSSENFFK